VVLARVACKSAFVDSSWECSVPPDLGVLSCMNLPVFSSS
jgi:hypothetical protein